MPNHQLIAELKNSYEPILFKNLERELQDETKKLFGFNEKHIFLPFKSPELLDAVIILGERSNGVALKKKDIDFFNALISIINVFLFRLTPYEIIQSEFELNQRKAYELEALKIKADRITSLAHVIQEYNHEIRTPLQGIVVQAHNLPNSEAKQKISKYANKINDIVGTTLRLTGKSDLERKIEQVKINELLVNLIREYPSLNNIEFINAISKQPIVIPGDKKDIRMIFNNLIKNACDAMPEGGKLTLKSYIDEGYISIEIQDTGIGIPEEKLKNIWEPFQSRHVTKGRGLGLSIVYRLLQEHKGLISVKSTVGKETIFTVKLPVSFD